MRSKLTLTCILAAAFLAGRTADAKELFFAQGWLQHCQPTLERVARKIETSKDSEVNAECVAYVIGATDAAFLLLMHQKKGCPRELANRESVFSRTLETITKMHETERGLTPMVAVVNKSVVAQCGL